MKKFLLFLLLVLIVLTSIQLWLNRDKTGQKKQVEQNEHQREAAIGGDFILTDQSGKTVHDADFRGRMMLVFFGFTHCPDICPVTVATISKTMEVLGDKADQVAPIFVSVDSTRDTPEVMKDFLANFDTRLVGLTGTAEQIKHITQAYKVYYSKPDAVPPEKAGEPQATDGGIDHSAFIYLMGKDGSYIRLFPYNATAEDMATAITNDLN